MDLEPAGPRVPLVAARNVADKRLLTSVRQLVRLQVPLGDELLEAFVANEGSLSCVRPHVRLQVACLGKLLQTLLKGAEEDLFLLLWSLDLLKLACCQK